MAETWYSDLGYLKSNRVLLEIFCQLVSRDALFFLNCCRLEAISLEVTCMELCMKIPLWNTSCYCPHVRKALSPTLRLLATTLWMWVSSSLSVIQFKVWFVVFSVWNGLITYVNTDFRFSAYYYVCELHGWLSTNFNHLLHDVRSVHHTVWCSKCPVSGIGDSRLQVLMHFLFKCWSPHHTRHFIVAATV